MCMSSIFMINLSPVDFNLLCNKFNTYFLTDIYFDTITNDLYLPWFLEIIYWVVILAASIVLGFGLSGGALKLLRGEEVTFSSVLTSPFCKIKNVVLFYLLFVVFFCRLFFTFISARD